MRETAAGMNDRPMATLYVIATTDPGTAAALDHARMLAAASGGDTVLVVRRHARRRPATAAARRRSPVRDRHVALAHEGGATSVVFCACDRIDDVIGEIAAPQATLLIGGDSDPQKCRAADELADRLARAGYRVVLVEPGGRSREIAERPGMEITGRP
jgi:hypothetical protein